MRMKNTNIKSKKLIIWIVILAYVVMLVIVGKCFAERFAVAKIAESYLENVRQGIDDEVMDSIVETVISETIGNEWVGAILSELIGGDDVNDIYHALVNGMDYKVFAVEKTQDGRYRIGITVGNSNNILVARQSWEIIKGRYQGNAFHIVQQLWNDINGDITQLVSGIFYDAKMMLEENGTNLWFSRVFVITVDASAEGSMPEIENEKGYFGFVMTCAGIPMDVGSAPEISDQRKVYGAAFFVLLSAGIVAAIYYKRKNDKERGVESSGTDNAGDTHSNTTFPTDVGADNYSSPNNLEGKKAILYACSPQHNNMMFALHDTPIFIGRDTSECKVVFPQGTAGVSSKHCAISYDGITGLFVLTDLRSTYGTYLSYGEKLTANRQYYLKPGDSFYIGDPANLFRVDVG